MSKHIRPSIIAQRSVSLLTGRPRERVQNYMTIDPSKVARPVTISSTHVHAAAVALANARIHTTAQVIDDGLVVNNDGTFRASSLERWVAGILKGEF